MTKFYPTDEALHEFLDEINLQQAADKLADICDNAYGYDVVVIPPLESHYRPIQEQALRIVREQGYAIATAENYDVFLHRRAIAGNVAVSKERQAA